MLVEKTMDLTYTDLRPAWRLTCLALLGLGLALGGVAGAAEIVVANGAKDSKEAPYIQRLRAWTADSHLVLRFEGDLQLGRHLDALRANSDERFHHADQRLVITLDNEALVEFSLAVLPAGPEHKLALVPPQGKFSADATGVEVAIPLEVIQSSPVEVIAEVSSQYYAAEGQMVATTGRTLFAGPDGQAVRLEIPELPVLAGDPEVIAQPVATAGPYSATLEWETSHRTDVDVTVTVPKQPARQIRQPYRQQRHQLVIAELTPDTAYVATLTGRDFAGRAAAPREVRFQTLAAVTGEGPRDAWLHVAGRHIVDAAGRPFALGGYSHYLGEYWWNEFPRYGTLALTARHFRALGFNACRLGLVEHKEKHWSASIMNDGSAFERYGGPAGYAHDFLRPLVEQITAEGVYVILDWHWSYGLTPETIEKIGQFWEACAQEFKDEPRVAVYQLLNEPCFVDGQTRPDLAPRIRDITRDYIQRIRRHDPRHIILVSDWNCGWGWATESQWGEVSFDPGDPQHQIVYSKHVAKEHMTEAFMVGGVDRVVDKWNVPILFDEVELNELLPPRETAWFFDYLWRNPRKYGFLIWVCGQRPAAESRVSSAFAHAYLPKPPFGGDSRPIVGWWRVGAPETGRNGERWTYRYALPEPLPAGDYGLVIEGAAAGTMAQVVIIPAADPKRLLGTWLGGPRQALARDLPVTAGDSAVDGAIYWHALEPFTAVVVRTSAQLAPRFRDQPLPAWTEVQLFRLNPAHQMPVPRIESAEVQ
jgi:hypothetical protein